jgi:cell division cycle 14
MTKNLGSCIIEGKLYWSLTDVSPKRTKEVHYFSVHQLLQYEPFFSDFGPLHLGCLYRFCVLLTTKLKSAALKDKIICYVAPTNKEHAANSATLIALFQVICMERSVESAWATVESFGPYMPFRDAAMGKCSHDMSVYDCICAVKKALQFRLFDFSTFDPDEYEYFECVEHGDLNEIIKDRIIAFAGPHSSRKGPDGYPTLMPEDYYPIWKRYGVKTVIRLNKRMYERNDFIKAGYAHHDLFFIDGTSPSEAILRKFLDIMDTDQGVISIHCKAGLGRTGTLIACWMMRHYQMTARECIAWIRLCRPGSIIGPQQNYVMSMQAKMWEEGIKMRADAAKAQEAVFGAETESPTQSSLAALRAPEPQQARTPSSCQQSQKRQSFEGRPARALDFGVASK